MYMCQAETVRVERNPSLPKILWCKTAEMAKQIKTRATEEKKIRKDTASLSRLFLIPVIACVLDRFKVVCIRIPFLAPINRRY